MKILLDVNPPAPLARQLSKHRVVRAGEMGWGDLENGALLNAAEKEQFDLLLTCDQNIRFRQNRAGRAIAVLILSTRAGTAQVITAVDFIQRGQIVNLDL